MSSRGIPLTGKCTCCGTVVDVDELNEKGECATCESAEDYIDEYYDDEYDEEEQ